MTNPRGMSDEDLARELEYNKQTLRRGVAGPQKYVAKVAKRFHALRDEIDRRSV